MRSPDAGPYADEWLADGPLAADELPTMDQVYSKIMQEKFASVQEAAGSDDCRRTAHLLSGIDSELNHKLESNVEDAVTALRQSGTLDELLQAGPDFDVQGLDQNDDWWQQHLGDHELERFPIEVKPLARRMTLNQLLLPTEHCQGGYIGVRACDFATPQQPTALGSLQSCNSAMAVLHTSDGSEPHVLPATDQLIAVGSTSNIADDPSAVRPACMRASIKRAYQGASSTAQAHKRDRAHGSTPDRAAAADITGTGLPLGGNSGEVARQGAGLPMSGAAMQVMRLRGEIARLDADNSLLHCQLEGVLEALERLQRENALLKMMVVQHVGARRFTPAAAQQLVADARLAAQQPITIQEASRFAAAVLARNRGDACGALEQMITHSTHRICGVGIPPVASGVSIGKHGVVGSSHGAGHIANTYSSALPRPPQVDLTQTLATVCHPQQVDNLAGSGGSSYCNGTTATSTRPLHHNNVAEAASGDGCVSSDVLSKHYSAPASPSLPALVCTVSSRQSPTK